MFDLPSSQKIVCMSDREDFWSSEQIAQATYMFSIDPIDFSHFEDKKVLFLVHGYNNTLEEAQKTYQMLSQKMGALKSADGKPLYDLVIHYFWPGYHNIEAYFEAEKNAQSFLLTNRLAVTLMHLSEKATCVDVVAHSMGNRVMLEALSHVPVKKPLLRYFYSFAAAVNNDSIDRRGEYAGALKLCQSMYVFHSDVDIALNSYEVIKDHEALGSDTNIDLADAPANVQFIDCTLFLEGNHSGYFTSDADPIYLFIESQQKKGDISSVPRQWELFKDGSVKEGDVVLDWDQRCKALLFTAVARVTQ